MIDTVIARHALPDDLSQAAKYFNMLGDETRLRVVWLLNQVPAGMSPPSVVEINDYLNHRYDNEMDLSQPALSHHLGLLKEAGVVEAQRDGKYNRYSLTAAFRQWMMQSLHKPDSLLQHFLPDALKTDATAELRPAVQLPEEIRSIIAEPTPLEKVQPLFAEAQPGTASVQQEIDENTVSTPSPKNLPSRTAWQERNWLNLDEVSKLLHITPQQVTQLAQREKLDHTYMGRAGFNRKHITTDSLKRLMREQNIPDDIEDRVVLTIPEAALSLRVSRTEMMRLSQLGTVKGYALRFDENEFATRFVYGDSVEAFKKTDAAKLLRTPAYLRKTEAVAAKQHPRMTSVARSNPAILYIGQNEPSDEAWQMMVGECDVQRRYASALPAPERVGSVPESIILLDTLGMEAHACRIVSEAKMRSGHRRIFAICDDIVLCEELRKSGVDRIYSEDEAAGAMAGDVARALQSSMRK